MQRTIEGTVPVLEEEMESEHLVVDSLLPEEFEVVGHGLKDDEIPILSPLQIQQEYFETRPDADWNRYKKQERNYLLQNIAFAIFGVPKTEGELSEVSDNVELHLEGYTSRQKETVQKVYDKICEQSKYSSNGEDILVSILLIVCARPKSAGFMKSIVKPANYWLDLHTRTDSEIWCAAVFRVRKCIPLTEGAKACRVYIDENARVYQNWDDFMTSNTYPKCVMIVPENGEYEGELITSEHGRENAEVDVAVKLTVAPSPALGLTSRVLSTADHVTTAASLTAIGVIGAAAFTPVAPVVLTGAVVASVATGLYGLVRSSLHLHDRSTHQQSISPTESEARGSWLNIAASSVGLAGGAASSLLSRYAAAGTVLTNHGRAVAITVDVLRHMNILTGGAGMLHGFIDMVIKYRKHGERPTNLELFQLSAATLFFFQAVISTRTAKSIIEETQAKTINEYRATLRSNNHRKIFDKLSAEARRVQGAVQGNTEVIQGIQNINNPDQYFADVLKINKDLNQHKIRISMTADGKVNLNSQHKFQPSELYGLGREGRSELFSSIGQDTLARPNVSTQLSTPKTVVPKLLDKEEKREPSILVGLNPGELIRIGQLAVRVSSYNADTIAEILQDVSQEAHTHIMQVSMNLLHKLLPEELNRLQFLSPEESLIVQAVKFVFNYLQHERPLGEPSDDDNWVVIVAKEFFQDGLIRHDTILMVKDRFMKWIEEQIVGSRLTLACEVCNGLKYAV